MLASAPLGLQVLGGEPRRMAPRSYSAEPPAWFSGGRIGTRVLGTNKVRATAREFSGLLPSGSELGMGLLGGVVLGGPRRVASIRRAIKKQTGIPLRAAWQPSVGTAQAATRTPWSVPRAEILAPRQSWGAAQALQTPERAPWGAQHANDAARRAAWPAPRGGVVAHLAARPGNAALFGRAIPGLAPIGGAPARNPIVQSATALQASERSAWVASRTVDSARRAPWGVYAATADASARSAYLAAHSADSARRLPWWLYAAHADSARRSTFAPSLRADTPERFPFGARRPLQAGWGVVIEPGIPTPGPGDTVIIPVQRAYVMIHDISVIRLPDNLAIPAADVSLSIDADAWAWSFSARLLGKTALDAVQPDANGTPVTLEIALDGYVFRVLVEDWSEDRRFGNRSVSVKGRGLSAQLAAPYQLPTSGATTSDMTIQQVLNAHLPIGSGWTIAWAAGTPDWLVPTGAWTWADQSPIAAIFAACNGVGLTINPDPALQTLTIAPRYPVLPWDFAAATPQITVPDAAITELARRNTPPSQANAAFVYGGNVGGILARVYRTGTAGDKALAPAQHPLITHTDAARLLGSRLLAGQAQQPDVRSLTYPFGGTFGMAQRGALLEAQIGATPTRGIINAVQINTQRTAQGLKIRQTVTLGEDTPNVWAGFARLLPQDALRLATVLATFADGTATVQYPTGGTQRVRNPAGAAAGASVYVRGGRIDGTAPSLAQSDILV